MPRRTDVNRRPGPGPGALLLLFLGAGGCRPVLSALIDLPPPRPAASPSAQHAGVELLVALEPDTTRPPIERTLDPDTARSLLPRDHAGNIDWVQALRRGVIAPRSVLPGRRPPPDAPPFQFGYDFWYQGPDTSLDARFPHSTHTEWLDCQQCHSRIFPYRNTPVTMGDIFQGRYCAECHGRVAFPVMTACERCHRALPMPPDRAEAEFIGTLALRRDSAPVGTAAGMNIADLPAARFPHWVHRIRYRCKACHMEVFQPVSGANTVTMEQIGAGEACGRCHNGQAAFAATIGTCQRCHVAPDAAPVTSGP